MTIIVDDPDGSRLGFAGFMVTSCLVA